MPPKRIFPSHEDVTLKIAVDELRARLQALERQVDAIMPKVLDRLAKTEARIAKFFPE